MTMNTLWFLYTVALFAIALISCSLSLAVWMATRRRDCLVSASGFILYAMELSLIFFDEYARSKYEYPQSFDLPLTHPWESALLSVLFTGALWIWMLMRLHKDLGWRNAGIPIALYAVAAFILVPKEGMSSTLQQWAYWIVRDLTVIGSLGYALWCYRHTDSEAERLDLARSKRFYRLACVLAACIALEDTFMILIYRPPEDVAFVTQFLWHMSERNISENLLMVACAVQLLRKNQQVLSMYFSHPPVGGARRPRTRRCAARGCLRGYRRRGRCRGVGTSEDHRKRLRGRQGDDRRRAGESHDALQRCPRPVRARARCPARAAAWQGHPEHRERPHDLARYREGAPAPHLSQGGCLQQGRAASGFLELVRLPSGRAPSCRVGYDDVLPCGECIRQVSRVHPEAPLSLRGHSFRREPVSPPP